MNAGHTGARATWTTLRRIETKLAPLCSAARQLLSVACPDNGAQERVRLRDVLARGEMPQPRWEPPKPRQVTGGFRVIEALRDEIRDVPGESLLSAKLDELELDLALLEAVGDARRVRPLSKRRFPGGSDVVIDGQEARSLASIAQVLLQQPARTSEMRDLPPTAPGTGASLARTIGQVATAARLSVTVEVEPRLAAGAATGERTVYIADRLFGRRESARLAVHEVLGHLTSAANGRAQPLRLLEWGTAGSFADQEGIAIHLEQAYGLLDAQRLRTLAGRVVATDCMRAEWSFGETARHLLREHGFGAEEAITITERAYRGGGIARDASYLFGYLRVQHALATKAVQVDELRLGRVSVTAIPAIRTLTQQGFARPAVYRPSLSASFLATITGTTLETSPPKMAASFTRLELT